uniref:Uncharacterized protein n=1 Tax=Haemonchus contortus TaxID=6289 RepID=A0A7I4Z3S4_HAECO
MCAYSLQYISSFEDEDDDETSGYGHPSKYPRSAGVEAQGTHDNSCTGWFCMYCAFRGSLNRGESEFGERL